MDRSPHPAGGQEIAEREEERISVATQWQLMWWRFRKHRVAMASAVVVGLLMVAPAIQKLIDAAVSQHY